MIASRFSLAPITSLQIQFPHGSSFRLQPWPSAEPEANGLPPAGSQAVRLACRRLAIRLDTPLLHVEIRTPFGEVATDALVEAAIQSALGPHYETYTLRGWHVLRVEDTHVGSVHRILASLEDNQKPWDEKPLFDFQIPIELGLWGLGNKIGQRFVGKPWQLLLTYEGTLYSALFSGTDTFHIRSWAKNHPLALSQIQAHGASLVKALGSKDPTWVQVLGPGCQDLFKGQALPLTSESSSRQDSASMQEALSFFPALSRYQGDLEKANLALWSLGLGEAMQHAESKSHNQIEDESLRDLRHRRMRRVFGISTLVSAFSLLVCLAAWAAQYSQAVNEKKILEKQAQGYSRQVSALNDLRATLLAKQDSIKGLGPLVRREFPLSLLLSEVAQARGTSEIQGLQIKPADHGQYEAYLRAFTSQWENVEAFRRKLSQAPGIIQAEVLEQRKDAGKGKVFFDIRLWAQRP
jgi:hypothetical protein